MIKQLVDGGWVQLAVFEPESGKLQHYQQGIFSAVEPESTELPVVESSHKWYRGWRNALGFASIKQNVPQPATSPTL
ncbi:MAG: hypothetical protein R3C11_01780 [Planctomycetaceae bacterium]